MIDCNGSLERKYRRLGRRESAKTSLSFYTVFRRSQLSRTCAAVLSVGVLARKSLSMRYHKWDGKQRKKKKENVRGIYGVTKRHYLCFSWNSQQDAIAKFGPQKGIARKRVWKPLLECICQKNGRHKNRSYLGNRLQTANQKTANFCSSQR